MAANIFLFSYKVAGYNKCFFTAKQLAFVIRFLASFLCCSGAGFSYVWDYALSKNCKLLAADGEAAEDDESAGSPCDGHNSVLKPCVSVFFCFITWSIFRSVKQKLPAQNFLCFFRWGLR